MKANKAKAAVILAAMLMLGVARSPAFAQDFEPHEPNTINNETIPLNMRQGGAGIYDRYDHYTTPQGFPLSGWGHLRGMS